MAPRVLFTTVYKNDDEPYDYIGSNSRSRWFRFYWPRIQSFGLRFLKQNIPELEILEYPTWEEYLRKLDEGWDVVGFSFYLNETHEILEMVEAARARGINELWAGNYGALTPEIQDRFDRVFVGYAEHQVAPYFGRRIEKVIHPPLIEYLSTPFGLKLNIYGILFTTRGCGVGCKFCQTPCFAPKPTPIPLESIERVINYYKKNNINVVIIEDENFGANRRHADRVVEILDEYDMIWGCMARADYLREKIDEWVAMRRRVARRDGSARRMVSGFAGAAIGIENLHQERLDDIKKREGVDEIVETIKLLQSHGMGTVGYYMIGFEDDTVSSIDEDIKRVADLKLDITQICVLTPLPQTQLWNEIQERYGIFDHDYHHFDGKHLVWNHPHISPKEMEEVLDRSLKRVYPWTAPLRTSARVWRNAYRYAGIEGLKEVFSYITRANSFDFETKTPRLLV
ncbi:MAG: radical SAM protein [Methanothrix sp.]|nr:radical SAM protein [Methanothrix sp.]MCX8207870.1 radical SAM protein [Methanothrix sp.]